MAKGVPPKPFAHCAVTIFCLLLLIIAVVSTVLATIFSSVFVGIFILALAAIGSSIIPVILWLIDKTNLNVGPWLTKIDSDLEDLWNKWFPHGGGRIISQTTIRACIIIFLLCAIIAGNIIYPTVPQTFHNAFFPICGICADSKTHAGISDGRDHFWQEIAPNNSDNAETLIYNENRQIVTSHLHYVTIAIVAPLAQGGRHFGVGKDTLQAAYVLQHQANRMDTCQFRGPKDCIHVRLLVANAGDNLEYAPAIAQQVVQIAANDSTFIGVVGFPLSTTGSINGVSVLTANKIPVISSTASSDALTANSPFFFRIAPADGEQGLAAAQYVEKTFPQDHNVLVVYATGNPYSLTLATGFIQTFIKKPGNYFLSKTFDANSNADARDHAITDNLNTALHSSSPPNLIYFAGYSDDFNKLLNLLRTDPPFQAYSTLPIISGDSAYDLTGYTESNYQDIFFTAFASPDEWGNISNSCNLSPSQPFLVKDFFCDYTKDFDPSNQHPGSYGFSRPDDILMLGYDAVTVLIQGYLATHLNQPTEEDIQHAMQGFNICNPLQGVSGQIAFGPDNNPINKAIVLLKVDNSGHTIFLSLAQGQLRSSPSQEC